MRTFAGLLVVAGIVIAAGIGCGNSPTEPDCAGQTKILEDAPEYIARPESLVSTSGRLVKNCSANPRYCYYLDDVRIYTLGNETILDAFVNQRVLIVGKPVFPESGPGELWAGSVCRLVF